MTGDPGSPPYKVEASQLLEDLKKLVKKDKPLKDAIYTVLEKLESHPELGKPLMYQAPQLQGKVYSEDVQGRSGYRLIYVWEKKSVVWALMLRPRDQGYPSSEQIESKAAEVVVEGKESPYQTEG